VSNAAGSAASACGASRPRRPRYIAGFRQQSSGSLNVNYPIWPEPLITPETLKPMRQFLQARFCSDRGSTMSQPRGAVGNVSPEHLSMLLESKPEAVSFHFGLPEPTIVEALESAGIFVLSSATTVAEARLLEERGVGAVIA
jgi:nitronate monooxygenase